jgi:dimethylhistidine N-methyltransferase
MLDRASAAKSHDAFADAVLKGLARPQKTIPSEWLYDARGSALYEAITELPEYYVARTERAILAAHAGEIASLLPRNATLIEYGAGAAVKTRLLLDALKPAFYAPIDISAEFLLKASAGIDRDYPGMTVVPVTGHFLEEADLSDLPGGRRVGFFPGSTIGNLTDAEIGTFFSLARRQLGAGSHLIVGADRAKDVGILLAAYDDAAGLTAAFNRNLLSRINRELCGGFAPALFRHEARFDAAKSRIEMHLVSEKRQVPGVLGRPIPFKAGESIRTEISRKFRKGELATLAAASGFAEEASWSDEKSYFDIMLFRPM